MAINESEYLNVLGFANGLPTEACDIGNLVAKFVTDSPVIRGANPLSSTLFEHAIVEIDEYQFRDKLSYYQNEPAFHLIEWRNRYFITGIEAYSVNPKFTPIQGRAKYTRDYYGILFVRGMLEMTNGNIPEELNVFLAHPPADKDFRTELMKSVHGRWKVHTNAGNHAFEVVYSNAFDEIVGGVHNATDGVDGQVIEGNPLEGNGPAIVFDLGGGSLDLAYLKKDLSVDYDRGMVSHRIGVNRAVENFKRAFDKKFRGRLVRSDDGITNADVIEIFMDEDHIVYDGGEMLDCRQMYHDAFSPIIRECVEHVRKFTRGSFVGLKSVLVTGGGSAVILDRIKQDIFKPFHDNGKFFTTDSKGRMIYANSNGGLKIATAMKSASKKRADIWLKGQHGK